jgi:transcriptional regulator with XRE-family HTH domain
VTITAAQCRAARALIGMSRADLGQAAIVPVAVLMDFEEGARVPEETHLDAIRRALEAAGVDFTNGSQPGVRLGGPGGTIAADQLNASNDE